MSSFTELDLAGDAFVFTGHDTDGDGQAEAYGIKKKPDSSTAGWVKDDPEAWAVTQAGLVEHDGDIYLLLALDEDGDGAADSLTITKYADKSTAGMGLVDPDLWTVLGGGTTDGDAVTKKMDSSSTELVTIPDDCALSEAVAASDWHLGL